MINNLYLFNFSPLEQFDSVSFYLGSQVLELANLYSFYLFETEYNVVQCTINEYNSSFGLLIFRDFFVIYLIIFSFIYFLLQFGVQIFVKNYSKLVVNLTLQLFFLWYDFINFIGNLSAGSGGGLGAPGGSNCSGGNPRRGDFFSRCAKKAMEVFDKRDPNLGLFSYFIGTVVVVLVARAGARFEDLPSGSFGGSGDMPVDFSSKDAQPILEPKVGASTQLEERVNLSSTRGGQTKKYPQLKATSFLPHPRYTPKLQDIIEASRETGTTSSSSEAGVHDKK